ncbi:MAG: sigma-54 dependent transcriptional regulator [Verrucomicrobiota bacterium]
MTTHRILIVDDSPVICKSLEDRLRSKRHSVTTCASLDAAEKKLATSVFDLIFLDVELPDGDGRDFLEKISELSPVPLVIMITANTTIKVVVDCMRSGAFDYITKPFSIGQIDIALKKASDFQRQVKVTNFLNRDHADSLKMIGDSPAMRLLRDMIFRVAKTNATVMICGENGTGKELVANEIFLHSQRVNRPYIKVNCAVISEKLIESEFFGHEKGAFTGATEQRDGRFELADGGTILLDEISEIPIALQAKLLRVLQEREFERVGGNKTIKVDLRVLATTNRNLKKAVENGSFREDLYYRLNVFPVNVPPLRERVEDIKPLAEFFFQLAAKQNGLKLSGLSEGAIAGLLRHRWPGNVRELQNVIERACILAEDGKPVGFDLMGLPPDPQSRPAPQALSAAAPSVAAPPAAAPSATAPLLGQPLRELEKAAILQALDLNGGNRTKAAEALQISIRTLRNKLAEYRGGGELPEVLAGDSSD